MKYQAKPNTIESTCHILFNNRVSYKQIMLYIVISIIRKEWVSSFLSHIHSKHEYNVKHSINNYHLKILTYYISYI